MQNQISIRFILFATVAIACTFWAPSASISQTSGALPVPCPAAKSYAHPVPPPAVTSKNLPTHNSKPGHDQPLSGTQYDCGHPTGEEQLMLELINRARANPDSEGIRLSTTTDAEVANSYNGFGTPTRAQVASDFSTYPSRPPLAFNADLLKAARGHDNEMILVDSQYHVGPDGDPGSRIDASGYTTWTAWGENVFAYGDTDIWYDHASFQIDFGNPSLGHRHNIMNFASDDQIYTEVGLGLVHGGTGYPNVGTVLTTEDYVTSPKVFVLGVVYSDHNGNGFYDEGEGDTGVKITLSSGSTYFAVSSGSGGYAIPYTGSGTVTVTATGGPFSTPVTKQVDLNGQNVKVDFSPDLSGFPSQVSLIFPINDTVVNTSTVDFAWDTMTVATSYHIQIATDALFKNIFKNDSNIKNASIVLGDLQDGSTYYWRVEAKNTKAVGTWSLTGSFSVALAPSTVVLIAPANNSNVGDSNIVFSWNAGDRNAFGYWLIVARDKAMTDTAFSDNTLQGDPTETVDSSKFQVGQTYYWEVLAQNENGWSTPGTPWSFTLSAPDAVTPAMSGSASITMSPNPSLGSTRIGFTLANAADVSMRVFNVAGAEVQSIAIGQLSAGSHEYLWDCSALVAGSYSCQLRIGDRIENTRVVILK